MSGENAMDYTMRFTNQSGKEIGIVDFGGDHVTFSGDADESARIFFDCMCKEFIARLVAERDASNAALRAELAAAQCEARDKATIIALRDAELAAAKVERDKLRRRLNALGWELSPDATDEQRAAFDRELSRRAVGLRSGSV